MLNRHSTSFRYALLGAAWLASSGTQAITVDGNLTDWGLTFAGAASDWTQLQVGRAVGRRRPDGGGAFLSPGWGGQAYDAEALYMTWNSTHLYVAMVTGHNPNTAHNPAGNSYGRGDFAFDFNLDGTWDFGFATANRSGGIVQGSLTRPPMPTGPTACGRRRGAGPVHRRDGSDRGHPGRRGHPGDLGPADRHGRPRRQPLDLRAGNPGQRFRRRCGARRAPHRPSI